ncbi:MAG: hypothetical protein U5K56_19890 [Halioglobus sp.]|nr:hypothetical protein [Halioglobus sp.]
MLVDHSGLYHLGTGSRVQYRGAWLFIDDVAVFTGTRLLPAFAATQLRDRVWPLARAGIKVDHRTVLVRTLQNRHPIALGNLAIAACLTGAGALLLGPAVL